jgi:16S rRNA (guanine966-N2)-methyltransferase
LDALAPHLRGARILDLFSGTGALGLEALSRGADWVDFVEWSPSALHALKGNVAALRARDRTRIFTRDAFVLLEDLRRGRPYEIALADPPYASQLAERIVGIWLERPFSRILSVEHATDRPLPGRGSTQQWGETSVTTYAQTPGVSEGTEAAAK